LQESSKAALRSQGPEAGLPHTELAVVNAKLPLTFITKRDVYPLADTVDTIFANGPGELHVYPPLKLLD
jgi:hypothetical protein